ncbi:MAG TPA: type II secretion system protein GspJ [Verrucomicrobiae bacterium]
MRHGQTIQLRARGFTLIEVLLAVVVFAIVLAAMNGVFFGALRLRNKAHEAFDTALPLQQTVGIIKRDLEGIMLPGGKFSGQFQTSPTTSSSTSTGSSTSAGSSTADLTGERVSPDIYTCSGYIDDTSPWAEVQKVAYFLAEPTNSTATAPGKDLVRSITHNLLPVLTDDPVQQPLLSGVESFALTYYDGTSWTETWDSTTATNLPNAIKVQITLAQEKNQRSTLAPIEFIVPVMVQRRTNSTQQATGGSQ